MDEEFTPNRQDVIKANLYLAGIIITFIFLTLIAFLFTEGRHYCVIPILRRCWPHCRWVLQHDKIESANEEKHSLQKDLAQHVLGLKKAQRQLWLLGCFSCYAFSLFMCIFIVLLCLSKVISCIKIFQESLKYIAIYMKHFLKNHRHGLLYLKYSRPCHRVEAS